MKSLNARYVLLHHSNYINTKEGKRHLTALRVFKNTKTEKFDISLYDHTDLIQAFAIKNITIKIIGTNNENLIEISNNKKPKIVIHLDRKNEPEFYANYIKAMII